jgi:hypothetical protein
MDNFVDFKIYYAGIGLIYFVPKTFRHETAPDCA